MKRFLIPGLVVVHLLLHALALLIVIGPWFPSGVWSDTLVVAVLMLGSSQGALLAIWIALGGRRTWLRVILATVGVVVYLAWCRPTRGGFDDLARVFWLMVTLGAMGFSAALLLLARFSGLELTRSGPLAAGRPRSQFFIRDILLWTTALAIVLSAARFLVSRDWCVIDFANVRVGAACAGLSLIAAACLWAALGQRRLMARLVLLPAAVGAVAALLNAIDGQPWRVYAMFLGLMAASLVASLLVVRWAGYRVRWQWRFSRPGVE
jgi:hypothetical protein